MTLSLNDETAANKDFLLCGKCSLKIVCMLEIVNSFFNIKSFASLHKDSLLREGLRYLVDIKV